MRRCFFYILLLLFFSANSFAQQTANGCLLSNNVVYTDKQDPGLVNLIVAVIFGGKPVYSSNDPVPLDSSCSTWDPTSTSQACKVCDGTFSIAFGLITGCNGSVYTGTEGTFTMVNCNLDGYTYLLGLSIGAFGLIVIRKRNMD